ncbi:MAG: hypothetical protein LC776_09860 [Acidobacteria bacterium]|nr:hypothetical protein [Acidobacteriota bacterium]
MLIHGSGNTADEELAWFDRAGKKLGTVGPTGAYFTPSLSPDEKRLAITRDDPQVSTADVWLIDLARGIPTRFTFNRVNIWPIWSPDGRSVVYASNRDGQMNLYRRAASGDGNDEQLLKTDYRKLPTDWSVDGKFILYETMDPKTLRDLWILPLSGEPFPFLQTDFSELQGRFSPDGKWIAYTSNESGTWQVYVQTFPAAGGKGQVSTAGGAQPQWRRDGRELFYLAPNQQLMAVDVKADGSSFEASIPRALFEVRTIGFPGARNHYVVTGDGQRFLVTSLLGVAESQPLIAVLNWTADLKR